MNSITMKQLTVGHIFITNEGYSITVINIVNNNNITVKFNDYHNYTTVVTLGNLNKGKVKNPYHRSVCGVGYMGVGPYTSRINGNITTEYSVWSSMLSRCYNHTVHLKQPTYINCTVHEVWHNFQNFAKWYCNTGYYSLGYDLDKDLLYPGNKVYSPETCCMLPSEINNIVSSNDIRDGNLPTGVYINGNGYQVKLGNRHIGYFNTKEEAKMLYQRAKQLTLKEMAEKWKHCISDTVYVSLITPNSKRFI